MKKYSDFLVIGTGIAGLSFALKAAEYGKVCIISKTNIEETNTRLAQGGIAAVMYEPDSYDKHIRDTISCGHGLCDEKIVELTIKESTDRIKELISWGVNFDKNKSGNYDLGKEGGHSENRVLHHKDNTGQEIVRALIDQVRKHPNIEINEHLFAIDIITQHHLNKTISKRSKDINCYGLYVLNPKEKKIDTYISKFTLLATGGCGCVYSSTTNSPIATGDGIAMTYRAKGSIEKMEFMQFHPTSLYNPKDKKSFLITEAIRGFGGILKTKKGEEFMFKYDKRGSLAPRDIVAKAIDSEMKVSGDNHIYLDCTHLDKDGLISHFPNIYVKCMEMGIDITKDFIPVVPAAHYICGGIKVDENARTTINNLYASGECASSALHGANRLASNSLLEALFLSHHAIEDMVMNIDKVEFCENIPDWNSDGMVLNEEMVLITHSLKEVQSIMSNYVGIVRSDLRLKRAFDRLEILFKETEELYQRSILNVELCELRNIINVAYLIIKMAMQRRESRGLHYTLNYPKG